MRERPLHHNASHDSHHVTIRGSEHTSQASLDGTPTDLKKSAMMQTQLSARRHVVSPRELFEQE